MKKIFICEYITGGGYINKKISKKLFQQAKIILKSLLKDFNKIPNIKIIYTLDYRFKKNINLKKKNCYFVKKNPYTLWKSLIKKSDFFFPIAPETNNELVKLIEFGRMQKKKIISNSINAVKKTTSKYTTYRIFEKNSIPTIKTFKNINKINFNNLNKWVIKPDDGAGCEENYIFDNKKKLVNFFNSKKNFVIQPLIKGSSYSVNIISNNKGKILILGFNKQKIFYSKNKIIFKGTEFLYKIPFEKKIKKYLNIIVKKIPGLNSFFGIDFIIFKKKVLFVDVNPRITTSYKQISKNLKINVAEKILNTL